MAIETIKTQHSRWDNIDFANLEFGKTFADHMVAMSYQNGSWQPARIQPYGEINVSPSLSAIHYGQSVFEGIKAFYQKDGRIAIFRLRDHVRRLNRSCERMCMPTLLEKDVAQAISEYVAVDACWVPKQRGSALYIRPFVFATDAFLGLRPSQSYMFMVIACPVGPYYKDSLSKPIKLLSSGGDYVRAVRGGTGEAKTSGNYAASLWPAKKAQELGYAQVLWLDGREGKYIDEAGTMNIFFVIDNVLVTPPLYGAVLDGITRRSVIALAKDKGMAVEERMISIDEVLDGAAAGRLTECFGTGTAAVLSPVGEIRHKDRSVVMNKGQTGPHAKAFYDAITAIQYGETADTYGWNEHVTLL